MFTRFLLLIPFVILPLGEAVIAQPRLLSTEEIYKLNKSAVVKIEVSGLDFKGNPQTKLGTGFLIHKDGYFLTAGHVVDTPDKWLLDPNTGSIRRKVMVTRLEPDGNTASPSDQVVVLYYDPQLDLALLRMTGSEYPSVRLGNSSRIAQGTKVHAIGWGDKSISAPVPGSVQISFDSRFSGHFRLDMKLEQGDSGGPVFDENGQVIGIVNAGRPDMKKDAFAIPMNLAGNMVNMTLQAAAVEESLQKISQIPKDVEIQFREMNQTFEKVKQTIKDLTDLAENLKEKVRFDLRLRSFKQPTGEAYSQHLVLRVQKEFPQQYDPDTIELLVYPAWSIEYKGDDSKKANLPRAMTEEESKVQGIEVSFDADAEKIRSTRNTGVIFALEERLKGILKHNFKITEGSVNTLVISGAAVSVKWKVKGKEREADLSASR